MVSLSSSRNTRVKLVCSKELDQLKESFEFIENFISSTYSSQSLKSSATKSKTSGVLSSSKKVNQISPSKKLAPLESLELKSVSTNLQIKLDLTSNSNSKPVNEIEGGAGIKPMLSMVPRLKRQQAFKENSPSAFDI